MVIFHSFLYVYQRVMFFFKKYDFSVCYGPPKFDGELISLFLLFRGTHNYYPKNLDLVDDTTWGLGRKWGRRNFNGLSSSYSWVKRHTPQENLWSLYQNWRGNGSWWFMMVRMSFTTRSMIFRVGAPFSDLEDLEGHPTMDLEAIPKWRCAFSQHLISAISIHFIFHPYLDGSSNKKHSSWIPNTPKKRSAILRYPFSASFPMLWFFFQKWGYLRHHLIVVWLSIVSNHGDLGIPN